MPKKEKNWLQLIVGGGGSNNSDRGNRRSGGGGSHNNNSGSGSSHESNWREKACPGYDKYCGKTIKYRTDWDNIPTYCPDCTRQKNKSNSPVKEPRQPKPDMWREFECPGVPGYRCGNTIRYRIDWSNKPTHCEVCNKREFEKPCSIPGCDRTIKYKLHYTNVRDVCGRCFKEMERGSEPRLCDKCGNLMFVAKGKTFTTCRDCNQAEQSEKHEALRRSVVGRRLSVYASSIPSLAQSLPSYVGSSDDVTLLLLDGAARQEWKMPPLKRGERVDGGFDRGNLPYNFPTIDMWDVKTGEATSIKSIDLGAQTYRNLNAMDRQIARYVCEMVNYEGSVDSGRKPLIRPEQIMLRTLILVAPLITARDYQLNYLYSVNDAFAGRDDICLNKERKPITVNVRVVVFIVD